MKTAADFLAEANQVVPRIDASHAIENHGNENAVFVDVRDAVSLAQTGTIAGSVHAPRGLIEFLADDTHALHKAEFDKSKQFYLVCAAGGQAALAGKTLVDMGFENVTNIGGISDWQEAGGKTQEFNL